MTGELVVKDWATGAVVVARERASNRGMKNIFFFYSSSTFICQRVTGKETGKNSLHCLHGETLARQPEMFDKAREKRSLSRYAAVERVCNLSVFNGTVKQQWLTKDFAVCPRSSFSNCAQERNERLTRASTLVHFVRSRDVAATTAAVLLLLCC